MTSLKALRDLARDRPEQTPEWHGANDFYGHAALFKRRLGIDPDHPLKVMLEHGPTMSEYVWDVELRSPFKRYLCAGPFYADIMNRAAEGRFEAVPIGPFLAYTPRFKELRAVRPDRRTLLVFPWHSTHHFESRFDRGEHAGRIEGHAKGFDHVVVCHYWRDVLQGRTEAYAARGFECVTAGHMYDPLFLHRLLEIISRASMVVSGYPGTDVLYSVLMERPVWIDLQEISVGCSSPGYKSMMEDILSKPGQQASLVRLFGDPRDALEPDQRELVGSILGVDHLKSDAELLELFQAGETLYSQSHGDPSAVLPLLPGALTP